MQSGGASRSDGGPRGTGTRPESNLPPSGLQIPGPSDEGRPRPLPEMAEPGVEPEQRFLSGGRGQSDPEPEPHSGSRFHGGGERSCCPSPTRDPGSLGCADHEGGRGSARSHSFPPSSAGGHRTSSAGGARRCKFIFIALGLAIEKKYI